VEGRRRPPSLIVAPWPERQAEREDAAAEEALDALMELIGQVRTLRAEYEVPPAAKVEVRLADVPAPLRRGLDAEERALRRMAGVAEIRYVGAADGAAAGAAAHAVLKGGAELTLPLAGVIDLEREIERLGKERARLEGLLRGTDGKLANEQFRARAPAEVVAKEEEKAANLRDQVLRLGRKLDSLRGAA